LTQKDRKNYVLNIEQRGVNWIDTNAGYNFIRVPVKLSNYSDDTFKYMNWTCSLNRIFTFNRKYLSNVPVNCLSNSPEVIKLAPHQSATMELSVAINKESHGQLFSFKAGIFLCKYRTLKDFITFEDIALRDSKFPDNSLIWSNEVTIPTSLPL
jgi:hypothetical protein